MPQKRATFMILENDDRCEDVRRYIEDAGILLDVRNLRENPPSVRELESMFGHNPLTYFVNAASSDYERLGLDRRAPDRAEMLALISENPGLLRVPIIKTVRLLTIGCNKDLVAEVLQINSNGDAIVQNQGHRPPRVTRRALPQKK